MFWVEEGGAGWVMANTITRAAVRLPMSGERHGQIFTLLLSEAARDQEVWLQALAFVGDGLDGHFELFTEYAPQAKETAQEPA